MLTPLQRGKEPCQKSSLSQFVSDTILLVVNCKSLYSFVNDQFYLHVIILFLHNLEYVVNSLKFI